MGKGAIFKSPDGTTGYWELGKPITKAERDTAKKASAKRARRKARNRALADAGGIRVIERPQPKRRARRSTT